MTKLLGYAQPLSVAPGENLRVMLNATRWSRQRIEKRVVRLICADTSVRGPGFSEGPCDWPDHRHFWSAHQPNDYDGRRFTDPEPFEVPAAPGGQGPDGRADERTQLRAAPPAPNEAP